MIHEILPVGPLQCNCSVIGDEISTMKPWSLIRATMWKMFWLVRKHNLQVKQIVITHAHIDHGRSHEAAPPPARPFCSTRMTMLCSNSSIFRLPGLEWLRPAKLRLTIAVTTGDTVKAGSLTAGRVLHTPGHTEGSICLYFAAEKKLIAGDTLFAGSIGRTDLPGGSFEKIINSLRGNVLALPDDTVVVPGHGPMTTIGEERESNPFLGNG